MGGGSSDEKKKDGRKMKKGRMGGEDVMKKKAGGSIQCRMYLCNQHKHNARINLQAVECVGDEVAIVGL